jgi:hypothetical protein
VGLASIRTLYEHHWWANRTLLDAAVTLGEARAAEEIGRQFSEPSRPWPGWASPTSSASSTTG